MACFSLNVQHFAKAKWQEISNKLILLPETKIYCTNCPIFSKNFQGVENFGNFWQESVLNIQII